MDGIVSKLVSAGLSHVVVVGQLSRNRCPDKSAIARLSKQVDAAVVAYPDFLDKSAKEIRFRRGLASEPLWVLFSSGTSEPLHEC